MERIGEMKDCSQKINEIYDHVGDYWWSDQNPPHRLNRVRFSYFREVLGPLDEKAVLDVGCGGGLLSEEFARHGARVVGIDVSVGAIDVAREHARVQGFAIDYKVGSAEALPFDDAVFDIVACVDCLEHVDSVDSVVKEVGRVLRNGGAFCYLTINRTYVSRTVNWVVEKIMKRIWLRSHPEAMNMDVHDSAKFIEPERLYRLMENNGLRNRDTRGIVPSGISRSGMKFSIGQSLRMAYLGYAEKV